MDKQKLDQLVERWLKTDKNPSTRKEIEDLVAQKNDEKLWEKLSSQIAFGTAGLRGEMGAGFALMNDVTVIQTTQGLCSYLLHLKMQDKGVVIGHDHRHNSSRFAKLSAGVFLKNSIKVYFFRKLVHTPMVPFTVELASAACGIMITASHNPKQDNGYKVYWDNAAQLTSPHDKEIFDRIKANPNIEVWDEQLAETSPLSLDPEDKLDVIKKYFDSLDVLLTRKSTNPSCKIKFIYTPVHGVGYPFAMEAFKRLGFPPFHVVEEQKDPNPDFPTVKYPNPEEGAETLDLAIHLANKEGAQIILANDPDADRFSACERTESGKFRILTGNEIAILLADYIYSKLPDDKKKNVYMIRSAVSSYMMDGLAKAKNFKSDEALTGFKWIANKWIDLEKQGNNVIFAFEEAIGFMVNRHVKDKDGITSMAVFCELTAEAYEKGMTLLQKLDSIHREIGYYASNNSYFICRSSVTKQAIFDQMRYWEGSTELKFPQKVGNVSIKSIRDLTVGYDSAQPDHKPVLPVSQSTQMITFILENGATVTIRSSGTEPKIKYYIEHHGDYSRKQQVDEELAQITKDVCEFLIQPSKHTDIQAKS